MCNQTNVVLCTIFLNNKSFIIYRKAQTQFFFVKNTNPLFHQEQKQTLGSLCAHDP